MKIIITGHYGMLGRDLVTAFSDDNTKIISLGRDLLDITNKTAALTQINSLQADVLIHTAAFTAVDQCETEEETAFMVNGEGTAYVAEGCKSAGTKMVYISTDYLFDGKKGGPYTEDDTPNPLSVYGKSKFAGERFVKEILDDFLIIRTSWLFGIQGKNFVDTILEGASNKPQLKVVDDQKGSPTFSSDLSYAVNRLIKKNAQGVVHVANSGECSWYLFAKKILELSGKKNMPVEPIASFQLDRPAPRPCYSALDCTKFSQITGAKMRSWEEALKEYLLLSQK